MFNRSMFVFIFAFAGLLFMAGCESEAKKSAPDLPYSPQKTEALPVVTMKTSLGDIKIELFEDDCPNVVSNFITLAEKGYYKDTIFHSVEKNLRVSGGKSKADDKTKEKLDYILPGEFYDGFKKNDFGTIAMMNLPGTDQSASEFFFNVNSKSNAAFDNQNVVFGKVVKGMEVVEAIAALKLKSDLPVKEQAAIKGGRNQPLSPPTILGVEVVSKRGHSYEIKDKRPQKKAPEGFMPRFGPRSFPGQPVIETAPIVKPKIVVPPVKKVEVKKPVAKETEEKNVEAKKEAKKEGSAKSE